MPDHRFLEELGLPATEVLGYREYHMRCERFRGFIVAMYFRHEHTWEYDGSLCRNCGNVLDPLLAINRESQTTGLVGSMAMKGMGPPRGAVGPSGLRVFR